jgi:hypothetical protein
MPSHVIDELVRVVNNESFSEAAHGAGHRVVLSDKRASPYKKSLLGKLIGRRGEVHYFVKRFSVPKQVEDWKFRWSEGTNAVTLDFDASFVIQANEDIQALRLVEALSGAPSPGEVLYQLISGALNDEMNALREGQLRDANLLDLFRRATTGIGESEELDQRVSERVRQTLGGALFRIGLQLRNVPPLQVEVSRTGQNADRFILADSRRERFAETTALLRLENYQTYRKSGLKNETEVRETMSRAISEAVKALLFASRYYDVVQHFSRGNDPIEGQMRKRIEYEARTIGFAVQMFQSLPDIAALKLRDPVRVDIPADAQKYDLKNAVGYVQFAVSLTVRLGPDVSRLYQLIVPDAPDVKEAIADRVQQICRDVVQSFDHLDFNLHFDGRVKPALQNAIVERLVDYGLEAEIVGIQQAPTEDAKRFKALRGRTIDFDAEIKPQANRGEADPVPIAGTIEVVGMVNDGWEQFESKDFGYRDESPLTDARMRDLASRLKVLIDNGPWSKEERRNIAIELELADICQRVKNVLEGRMAMGPDLTLHWTNAKNDARISEWAERLACEAIGREFGLSIEVRAFRRLDTDADISALTIRKAKHHVVREAALDEAKLALDHEREEREMLDTNRIALIKSLGQREREVLDDPDSEEGKAVAERLRRELEKATKRPRLSADRASLALAPRQKPAASVDLPWLSAPEDLPKPRSAQDESPQSGV